LIGNKSSNIENEERFSSRPVPLFATREFANATGALRRRLQLRLAIVASLLHRSFSKSNAPYDSFRHR